LESGIFEIAKSREVGVGSGDVGSKKPFIFICKPVIDEIMNPRRGQ
jgi:hypothetical protein